jgi:hypothetical protein
MDQAERRAASVTTHAAASDAVKEAQRALNAARRIRGTASERSSIIRELERKLEQVKRTVAVAVDASEQAGLTVDRIRRQSEFVARVQADDRLGAALLGVPSRATSQASATVDSRAHDPGLDRQIEQVATPETEIQADQPGPMQVELQELRAANVNRQQIGDFSEAIAAGFLGLVFDYGILSQHNVGDKPQGLDIVAVTPSGHLETIEVKGTTKRNAGKPQTANPKTGGKQGGAGWIVDRSRDSPISVPGVEAVGDADGQIRSRLCRVDLRAGTISIWSIDANGKVADTPDVMAPLDEVVQAIDAS